MKGISIVVPIFNSGKYLEELMLSIKSLNIKNDYEILLVDDGSTDFFTCNLLEKLKFQFHIQNLLKSGQIKAK
jgi:cellulose synthase/poly-beta-1,6-N-acetylglucosamine synthase-like glycosyltransferase